MSTVRKPSSTPSQQPPSANPFFYGWRDVCWVDDKGEEHYEQVLLTEEDVLHPQPGDHVTQNLPHLVDCNYLFSVFRAHLAARTDTVVLSDQLILWDIPDPELKKGHGPDIAVIPDVAKPRKDYESFDVAKEGVRPELIVEVTSPATRNVDLTTKRRHYYLAGVQYYVIVDGRIRHEQRQMRILGYQRGPQSYQRLRLNAEGRLWLPTVGLWLGQENGRVVCYDSEGQPIPDPIESEQARQQAEQARQQAEQARQQAEQARQQAEQARQQAEVREQQAEQARQQAERARREAEARSERVAEACLTAEAEVARLRALLDRRQGERLDGT